MNELKQHWPKIALVTAAAAGIAYYVLREAREKVD